MAGPTGTCSGVPCWTQSDKDQLQAEIDNKTAERDDLQAQLDVANAELNALYGQQAESQMNSCP